MCLMGQELESLVKKSECDYKVQGLHKDTVSRGLAILDGRKDLAGPSQSLAWGKKFPGMRRRDRV